MGIIDSLLNKLKEPVFIKDFDFNENLHLKQLTELLNKVGDDQKDIIQQEINKIKTGLSGEQNVHYELRNSRIPMLCLHDIRLEHQGYIGQCDFIVICREFVLVLETKKLVGDINIDNEGNFVRIYKNFKGEVYKKEGMYSPITQNHRHVALIEEFLKDNKLIKKVPVYSLVVVANDKTIVNKQYATAEIKKLIIKYDQLTTYINKLRDENSSMNMGDKQMYEIANAVQEHDSPIEFDYIKRLNLKIIEKKVEKNEENEIYNEDIITTQENKAESTDELYERLRQYRSKVAKERNIEKLYFIFNNQQLSDLVLNRPITKSKFISLSGFGEKKYQEYGEEIISIIKAYITETQDSNKYDKVESIEDTAVYKELREYRLKKSNEEGIKPYLIYNNKQLEDILSSMPKDKNALLSISGFGEVKVDKYGYDIINILKKY